MTIIFDSKTLNLKNILNIPFINRAVLKSFSAEDKIDLLLQHLRYGNIFKKVPKYDIK